MFLSVVAIFNAHVVFVIHWLEMSSFCHRTNTWNSYYRRRFSLCLRYFPPSWREMFKTNKNAVHCVDSKILLGLLWDFDGEFSSYRLLVVCVGDMVEAIPGTEDGWESFLVINYVHFQPIKREVRRFRSQKHDDKNAPYLQENSRGAV